MGRRRRNQSRQQPPLPTTPPAGVDHDKVCIVFSCLGEDTHGNNNVHYKLCVVDLHPDVDGAGGRRRPAPISPTLQIDTGSSESLVEHAFCVWNKTTLYVFEGCDPAVETDVAHNQKSVFTYDLRSLIDSTTKKSKTMIYLHERDAAQIRGKTLTKVGDMIYPKRGPTAVPTPDGKKILLLATHLAEDSDRSYGGIFELFDPVTKSSEPLPSIPGLSRASYYSSSSVWHANSHGFISMYEFAVNLPPLGKFVIDLEHDRVWKHLRPESIANSIKEFYQKVVFFVVEDRFLFDPDAVRDISKNFSYTPIPSSFDEPNTPVCDDSYPVFPAADLTLLKHDKDKGECYFCVLNSLAEVVPSPFCNLSIDVCRAVYPKKGEEEKPVEVELKSSRRLKLSGKPNDYGIGLIYPCFLFCI